VKAYKGTKTAQFSEAVWKSGAPQRYGWRTEDMEESVKSLPAEIVEFAAIRKKVATPTAPEPEPEQVEPVEPEAKPVAEAKPKAKRKTKKK